MNQFFSIITLMLIANELAQAYQTGAPSEVCKSMVPEHGVPPQAGASPYTLSVNKNTLKAGNKVTVKISSPSGTVPFKGFFIQARNSANVTLGTFEKVSGTNVIDCPPGTKNAITHANPSNKTVISVLWTAPQGKKDSIHFVGTVVKDGEKFWVDMKSQEVTFE